MKRRDRHHNNAPEYTPETGMPNVTALDGRRSKSKRLIPLAIFAGFAIFISYNEIPVFRNAIERLTAPEKAMAGDTCRSKALSLGQSPDYARIIEQGMVNKTQKGYFVEKIIVGEMSERGGEVRFSVDCYADGDGNFIRADLRN